MQPAQAPGEVLSERAHSVLAAAAGLTAGWPGRGCGAGFGLLSPRYNTPRAHRVSDHLSVFPV